MYDYRDDLRGIVTQHDDTISQEALGAGVSVGVWD